MTRGALTGLLCGIALGDSAGAVMLGLCGLIAGLFFAQSRVLAVISGFVSSVSYAVYLTGADAFMRYIPNIIIGFALYLPASAAYAKIVRKRAEKSASGVRGAVPALNRGLLVAELPAGKLSTMSEAFHSLSIIFSEFAERIKLPAPGEIRMMAEASFDKACADCERRDTCRLAGIDKSNAAKKCADYIKYHKRLEEAGIPQVYLEECVKITEIRARINQLYCGRIEENAASNKTDIFAANFENISKLLQNNIKAGKEDVAFKKDISAEIYTNLEEMGIDCDNVVAIGERKKIIYIFGVKMVNYSGTIQEITDMLERVCGTGFGDPEYILRDDYIIMKSQSRNKFRIYSMQASKSAGELKALELYGSSGKNSINGDSISVFDGCDGFCYGLISDGMGSGRNAALSSRLTALVMEKLLGAGNQKDLTLEMLNSLLLAKNDECFASVDLFEADLITGTASFIKAGAAPSFIVRSGRLFKIQSSTVPAGIISGINSEQTKFELENGDYILMLSDGILSTFEEGAWLFEMLESERNFSDPESLLHNILNEASRKNQRKDDMSVLFMRVAGA
jgi:stage II sporulation protein E